MKRIPSTRALSLVPIGALHSVSINAANGTLSPAGWELTQGATPRYFGVDPSGTELYAANQGSDTVVRFHVNQATGRLTPAGETVKVGAPCTIAFR